MYFDHAVLGYPYHAFVLIILALTFREAFKPNASWSDIIFIFVMLRVSLEMFFMALDFVFFK